MDRPKYMVHAWLDARDRAVGYDYATRADTLKEARTKAKNLIKEYKYEYVQVVSNKEYGEGEVIDDFEL